MESQISRIESYHVCCFISARGFYFHHSAALMVWMQNIKFLMNSIKRAVYDYNLEYVLHPDHYKYTMYVSTNPSINKKVEREVFSFLLAAYN